MKNGIGTAIVVICLLLQASLLHAFRFTTSGPDREDTLEKAVLYLTGASDMESLSEEEADRWWRLSESPLPLNLAGRGRLEASGLLSAYQIASLLDYRSHSGDILSIAELSAVDGFGRETAEALSMFVTLESAALPGRSSDYRPSPRGSMSAGGGDKLQLDSDGKMMENTYSWYGRFRSYADGRYDAGVAFKRYYADAGPLPSSYSGYAAAYGRRHLEKVVLGGIGTLDRLFRKRILRTDVLLEETFRHIPVRLLVLILECPRYRRFGVMRKPCRDVRVHRISWIPELVRERRASVF